VSNTSELYFGQIAVGQMANFAYLVGSNSTREALLVDPAWSVDALLDQAEADGMKVVGALVTHYHQDHVGGSIFGMNIEGVDRLLARQPMPLYVNEHEAEGTKRVTGASESDLARKRGGDTIELGGIRVRLLHTPGHTPGSQCFLVEEAGQPGRLVSGDTLFLERDAEAPARRDAALSRPPLLGGAVRHARPREAHEPVPARREPRSVPDVHGGVALVASPMRFQ
jgi:glyoxylase-like metal-dependent hydrolase (beta-lactamase superfamily II)